MDSAVTNFVNNIGVYLFNIMKVILKIVFLICAGTFFIFKSIKGLLYIRLANKLTVNLLAFLILILINCIFLYINTFIEISLNFKYFYLLRLQGFINNNIVIIGLVIIEVISGLIYKNQISDIKQNLSTSLLVDRLPKIRFQKSKDTLDLILKTFISYHEMISYSDKLEISFGMKIYKFEQISKKKIKIVFVSQNLFDCLSYKEEKEVINFKDKNINLKERIEGVFDFLDITVQDMSIVETLTATLIYFNSVMEFRKFEYYLDEIKHRLKINNLIMGTSNIDEFDYMLKISKKVTLTFLKVYLEYHEKLQQCEIPILLGMNHQGEVKYLDMNDKVHYLIAGTNGSGKTNNMHNLICSMLLRNNALSMFIIDTKKDLKCYSNIPNVLRLEADDSQDVERIIKLFDMLIGEVKERNTLFTKYDLCDNIEKYNKVAKKKLPHVVFIIEEYAELLARCTGKQKSQIETKLQSLGQLSRSAGYKIFISTQSPSKNIVTSAIKANFPNRMVFMVSDLGQSNVVLGNKNATNLTGIGEYIHRVNGQDEQLKALYIPDNEKQMIIEYLEKRNKKIKNPNNLLN